MLREWIIFALCLGAGGHIAMAVVLHAPETWPWTQAGLAGLLTGLGLYGVVQLSRVLWRVLRPSLGHESEKDHEATGFLSP